ncbi:hypothetical protein ACWGRK_17300 [Saccharomonospora azurea]
MPCAHPASGGEVAASQPLADHLAHQLGAADTEALFGEAQREDGPVGDRQRPVLADLHDPLGERFPKIGVVGEEVRADVPVVEALVPAESDCAVAFDVESELAEPFADTSAFQHRRLWCGEPDLAQQCLARRPHRLRRTALQHGSGQHQRAGESVPVLVEPRRQRRWTVVEDCVRACGPRAQSRLRLGLALVGDERGQMSERAETPIGDRAEDVVQFCIAGRDADGAEVGGQDGAGGGWMKLLDERGPPPARLVGEGGGHENHECAAPVAQLRTSLVDGVEPPLAVTEAVRGQIEQESVTLDVLRYVE